MSLKSAFKDLASIQAAAAKRSGGSFDGESPFLQLKDGDSLKIRFMQELTPDGDNYDKARGSIVTVEEHVSPKDFKKRAVCTMEQESRCWACEQMGLGGDVGKSWKPKMRYYANVIVRTEAGDKVKILAQGFGKNTTGNDLIDYTVEYKSLTDRDFKISREGSTRTTTSYKLIPLGPKALTKAEQSLELIDVEKFVNYIAYDKQADFYNVSTDTASKEEFTK